MTEHLSMRGLPYLPLDPQWLVESAAFNSSDPAIVRASMKILAYAWTAVPAATVPSDFRALASITGLSESQVGENHDLLFSGWELRNGRLCFLPMYAVCERIAARHGEAIQRMSDQAALVPQDPEEFTLVPPTPVASVRKGKHRIPKDWAVSHELSIWLQFNGFERSDDASFITEKFLSHYRANGEMKIDWDEAFKNFALKENRNNLPSRSLRPAPVAGGRAARYGTSGVVATNHNQSVLEQAAQRASNRGPVYG